ncbi:hypothetical protein [Streptomyces sp. OR43]|uniref:hypothetical protein n=1 Tax=Streptomyces sp. or43 TaxID=2478957 RepID=UPI002905C80F|nr:hypothetical protein [Streptomyces sp. or43]
MLAPLVLVACSGSGGTPGGERASASATGSVTAEPSARPEDSGGIDVDPAGLPTTRKEALDLIGRVIAEPAAFGPGVVKRSPYESDPATWPVLGTDCVWRQEKPASSVLATLSRSFEVPAADGKGPMRLAAVVTVHRTRDDARWEMAESVEETMRCPTQQLRQGEVIGSMIASSLGRQKGVMDSAEDFLLESGEYRNEELGGGPYPYSWYLSQSLQFTVAVTGKGAEGRSEQEVDALANQAHATMLLRLGAAVEKQS